MNLNSVILQKRCLSFIMACLTSTNLITGSLLNSNANCEKEEEAIVSISEPSEKLFHEALSFDRTIKDLFYKSLSFDEVLEEVEVFNIKGYPIKNGSLDLNFRPDTSSEIFSFGKMPANCDITLLYTNNNKNWGYGAINLPTGLAYGWFSLQYTNYWSLSEEDKKEIPTTTSKLPYVSESISKFVVNKDCSVMSEPNYDSEKVCVLGKGHDFTPLYMTPDGLWVYGYYDNHYCYVELSNLTYKLEKVYDPNEKKNYENTGEDTTIKDKPIVLFRVGEIHKVISGCNIHETSDFNSKTIGYVSEGTVVELLDVINPGEYGGIVKISVNGVTGWIGGSRLEAYEARRQQYEESIKNVSYSPVLSLNKQYLTL